MQDSAFIGWVFMRQRFPSRSHMENAAVNFDIWEGSCLAERFLSEVL